MGKRGTVTDYAGEGIYPGDLITYATRAGNRVRMTDAYVRQVTAVPVTAKGVSRVIPMLKVEPTGSESGFVARKSLSARWISAEHVRLVLPGGRANY